MADRHPPAINLGKQQGVKPERKPGQLQLWIKSDSGKARINVNAKTTVRDLLLYVQGTIHSQNSGAEGASYTCRLKADGEFLTVRHTLAQAGVKNEAVISLVVIPKPRCVLTASIDQSVKIWTIDTGGGGQEVAFHKEWVIAELLPQGPSILTSNRANFKNKIWNLRSGQCVGTLNGHRDVTVSAVFSNDGKFMLTASRDGTAKLWSTKDYSCVRTFAGHRRSLTSAVISSDSTMVATSSREGTVKLWSLDSGECILTIRVGRRGVNSVAFSPDGATLLTASSDDMVRLWSLPGGSCNKTFEGHEGPVNSACFSEDGALVLSASMDGTAKLWSLDAGKCSMTFAGHSQDLAETPESANVTSAKFSRDGTLVLTSSVDSCAKLWSVASGKCQQTFTGHKHPVTAAIFIEGS